MRSKESKRYWHERFGRLFYQFPEMKLTENRHEGIRQMMKEKYPSISQVEEQFIIDFLFVDREFRRLTQGMQKTLKKQLSGNYIKNETK